MKSMNLSFDLPELPFDHDALEPYVDSETMKIHHGKHHLAYANKFKETLNSVSEGVKLMESMSPVDILTNLNKVPESIKKKVINFGGGHVNHAFFWTILKKGSDSEINNDVLKAINGKFGSFDNFKKEFSLQASTYFGSGWTWLVVNPNKNNDLEILSSKNQDSPISKGLMPVLCIDLWEHAYYLKYKNVRPDYVENFFKIINWDQVNNYFVEATK